MYEYVLDIHIDTEVCTSVCLSVCMDVCAAAHSKVFRKIHLFLYIHRWFGRGFCLAQAERLLISSQKRHFICVINLHLTSNDFIRDFFFRKKRQWKETLPQLPDYVLVRPPPHLALNTSNWRNGYLNVWLDPLDTKYSCAPRKLENCGFGWK